MKNQLIDEIIEDINSLDHHQIIFVEHKKEGNELAGKRVLKRVVTKNQVVEMLKSKKE